MINENRFLVTYGLHGFVRHEANGGRSVFNISGSENRKMVSHAKSLIAGHFGETVHMHVV